MIWEGKLATGPSAVVTALLKVLAERPDVPLTAAELRARVPQLVVGHISSALRHGLIEVRDEVEVVCGVKTKMVAYRRVPNAPVPPEYADLPLGTLPDEEFTLTDVTDGWLKSATATALVRRGVLERLPEKVERVRPVTERKRRYAITTKGRQVVVGETHNSSQK